MVVRSTRPIEMARYRALCVEGSVSCNTNKRALYRHTKDASKVAVDDKNTWVAGFPLSLWYQMVEKLADVSVGNRISVSHGRKRVRVWSCSRPAILSKEMAIVSTTVLLLISSIAVKAFSPTFTSNILSQRGLSCWTKGIVGTNEFSVRRAGPFASLDGEDSCFIPFTTLMASSSSLPLVEKVDLDYRFDSKPATLRGEDGAHEVVQYGENNAKGRRQTSERVGDVKETPSVSTTATLRERNVPKKRSKSKTQAIDARFSSSAAPTQKYSRLSSTGRRSQLVGVTTSREAQSRSSSMKSRSRDPPNLQRYYKTELLTPEEEYRFGMRVKLMVQCEAVHEGLSLSSGRLPTITEWANACGYTETSHLASNFDRSLVESIRPAGSVGLREDRDPNMFVGNGLAGGAGVGRGNGRAKKAPPTRLGDFWDDSDLKFSKASKVQDSNVRKRKDRTKSKVLGGDKKGSDDLNGDDGIDRIPRSALANRGTVDDFVEMIQSGREAKQRMVQCNMRLAVSIAKRYRNVGVNIADLVQEGSIGLARAAEKFDPKRGFKFSTYASW